MGDAQVAMAIAVPVILGFVWLLRLEGRINLHQRLVDDLSVDVRYIRERIDDVLERRHHQR